MSRERQHQQSEDMRRKILDIAHRIITEEGEKALSIRRITNEINYSAGIIYHYFKNKDELLLCVLQDGYKRILDEIQPPSYDLPPDQAIRASFSGYFESVLTWSEEYKAVMLSSSPQILEFTAVLKEGICEKRPAIMALVATLEYGVKDGLFVPCDTQLTAQAIWSGMFGLLMRIIIEEDISSEQQTKLFNRQMDIILKGLRP